MDWGEKFERLRNQYRREDGSKWTGAALERATDGRVSAHFVSALRRDRIQDPGIEKVWAMSRVMGIPMDEWFEEEGSRGG